MMKVEVAIIAANRLQLIPICLFCIFVRRYAVMSLYRQLLTKLKEAIN